MIIARYIPAALVADYFEQGWAVARLLGWHGAKGRWIATLDNGHDNGDSHDTEKSENQKTEDGEETARDAVRAAKDNRHT